MQDNFYVYTHSKPDGTIFYVGKGKEKRCCVFGGRNSYHKNIVAKYGKENILVIKVLENLTEIEAHQEEIRLIAQLRRIGAKLANLTDGGDGMSGYVPSEYTRLLLSALNSGKNHPMFGKSRPPEVVEKIRLARTGGKLKETTKSKMSESRKGTKNWGYGKHLSDITKYKLSIINSGENHPQYGKPKSKVTTDKISEANSGENNGMYGVTGELHPNFGKKASKELLKKLSESHLGQFQPKGADSHNFGRKHSDETKKKMSQAGKNRVCTEEQREKQSIARKLWWSQKKAKEFGEVLQMVIRNGKSS